MKYDEIELRLDSWRNLRKILEEVENPLQIVCNYWKNVPFIPYNHNIDRIDYELWPTPWEIISENRYDDFTRAVMIAKTLQLTAKFSDSAILIKTMIDNEKNIEYNIVYVDNIWALNYDDNGPIAAHLVPESFIVENLIELRAPR